MDTSIEIKPHSRDAALAATGALEIFRAEIRDLSPHLAGISVNLAEAPDPPARERVKSVRVRVDFRAGGRYLSEVRGRDWAGLVPDAAARAARAARAVLAHRWELPEA